MLFLLSLPATLKAQFTFTTNNGAITITGYTETNGIATIPDMTNGYPVTTIGPWAFFGGINSDLTNVIIGTNVTSIGTGAFENCGRLANITIPDSVASIGPQVFDYCTSLASITIPGGVTNIGYEAFADCWSLTSITVDEQNLYYSSSNGVLFDKYQTVLIEALDGGIIGNYTIPDSVTNIATGAFADCTNLVSIVISDGITSIGSNVFAGCISLTNVAIPNSVASISYEAFNGCVSLSSITIPNSVTSIGYGAFNSCTSLTNIMIPNSVTNIGSSPGEVSVGNRLFGIYGLVEIAANCSSLTSITVDAQNLYYSSSNGVLFDKNQTTVIEVPAGIAGNYTVPNGATNIGAEAFAACSGLTDVIIPDSVASIGIGAFNNCGGLTNITIGANVVKIGDAAFASCASLTAVAIPGSVTDLGNEVFGNCGSLTSITVDALNLSYSSTNGILFDKSLSSLIEAPAGVAGNCTIPNSVTSIGNGAFAFCTNLTSITIPGSVTNIGSEAFGFCNNLNNIFFTGNAPSADSSIFFGKPQPPPAFSAIGFLSPLTVYYVSGTQGWGATFGGFPTVLWNPQAQTSDANFGVRTNRFGFNITGTTNIPVVVEACTNLDGAWVLLQSVSLTNGSFYFSDPQWTNYPGRFYRIRSP